MGYDPFIIDIEQLENNAELIGTNFVQLETVYYLLKIEENYESIFNATGT